MGSNGILLLVRTVSSFPVGEIEQVVHLPGKFVFTLQICVLPPVEHEEIGEGFTWCFSAVGVSSFSST